MKFSISTLAATAVIFFAIPTKAESLYQVVSTRTSANPSARYQEKTGCMQRTLALKESQRIQNEKDSAAGAAWIVEVAKCPGTSAPKPEQSYRVVSTRSSANPAARFSEGTGCMKRNDAVVMQRKIQEEKDNAAGAAWIVKMEKC